MTKKSPLDEENTSMNCIKNFQASEARRKAPACDERRRSVSKTSERSTFLLWGWWLINFDVDIGTKTLTRAMSYVVRMKEVFLFAVTSSSWCLCMGGHWLYVRSKNWQLWPPLRSNNNMEDNTAYRSIILSLLLFVFIRSEPIEWEFAPMILVRNTRRT
jgi:hypothetical protein